jgi:hypothetical protein
MARRVIMDEGTNLDCAAYTRCPAGRDARDQGCHVRLGEWWWSCGERCAGDRGIAGGKGGILSYCEAEKSQDGERESSEEVHYGDGLESCAGVE